MFERLQRRWKRSFGKKEQPWSVRPVEPQVLGASSVLGCDARPLRLVARTPGSHPGNRGSIPLEATS